MTRGTPRARATPGWTRVFRSQLRLVMLKRRRELILVGGAAALGPLLRLTDAFAADSLPFARFFVESPLFFFTLLFALLWPGAVWSHEGPGERAYHGSLPTPRALHDLTRVVAGGLWFHAVVAVGLGAGLLVLAAGWGRGTSMGSAGVVGAAALTMLFAYLVGTVPALVSRYPYRWILGSYVGCGLGVVLAGELARARPATAWLARTLDSVIHGSFGLVTAFEVPARLAAASGTGANGMELWGCLISWLGLAAGAVVGTSFLHLERASDAGP